MKKLAVYCGVMFLIAAALLTLETIGIYLWTRVPTTLALRDGKPAGDIALYQRDGKFLVQDGIIFYLIGHQPRRVGYAPPSALRQFHANYLHCRYPIPHTVEMNSSKMETDPRLLTGEHSLEFTNSRKQRIKVQWTL